MLRWNAGPPTEPYRAMHELLHPHQHTAPG
jgi:hypothetical protein